MDKQVVVITGGSSGIGKNAAEILSRKEYIVYELSRSGQDNGKITHINCDITNCSEVESAIKSVIDSEGKIDILINNAGFGISGALEFTEIEDVKRIFDVNLFGAIRTIKAVVPYMRAQKSGRIVNVSSVAGDIALPFQSMYSATKASLNSLTLALRSELAPFNISVTAVLPGDASSGFTAARKKTHVGDDIYSGRIERSVAIMERDELRGMDSKIVAKSVVMAATKRNVLAIYTIGFSYKLFVLIVKLLPRTLTNRIVAMIYAK